MKKSIIAFGLIIGMTLTTAANANNNNSDLKSKKIVATSIKDVAPLSIAVAQNNVAIVRKFIAFGADVEVKTKVNGMTPLMYAARYNNVELINILIANGADEEVKSKIGYTALQYAELSGAKEAVKLLRK
ncbi:ankyrin repeat domain-containing protein [Cellulophaga sp. HaHaR_3_176]|uniref:ankyrin repeat domain-containing protein n=1 Tax=Cellulophaga sp. HaHaR_3_176 TaxID=1942464 RepID=UPI001C1FE2C8|nr:ankyrin repeat domain-containing protein [Cellulophaga sp. HaHaR_3_176]QWX82971.1 ankyrin repeat domain-containing protein [Cellulophaga sp. HaHaR_3_176]QWX82972.1 ankyrin repeat domain-containing protein [Cellulophaga sp. HaHaR_3_176]